MARAGNGSEAALIRDCRLFRPLAENQPQGFLGLLQHKCGATNFPVNDETIGKPRGH
jgi:hypothetical protein